MIVVKISLTHFQTPFWLFDASAMKDALLINSTADPVLMFMQYTMYLSNVALILNISNTTLPQGISARDTAPKPHYVAY